MTRPQTKTPARPESSPRYIVLPIDEVKDDPRNENVHTDEQLILLRASIRIYDQQEDILIDRKHKCIAGHGIKQAMKLEGKTHISCKYSDLKGAPRDAYRIAANQLARLSHFDPVLLEANVRAISEEMGKKFDPELLALTQQEFDLLMHGDGPWKSRLRIDPASIGDYNPDDETFTIKVLNVKAPDKDSILARISRALKGTGYEAQSY